MHRYRSVIPALAATVVIAFSACKREETPAAKPKPEAPVVNVPGYEQPVFKVAAIELGKQLRDDKRVAEQTAVFAPQDTIYATVVSEGASPQVTLKAKWTYEGGQLVSESTQVIAPTGNAATEFHISKASGWPAGKYAVEIAANGNSIATKEFEVR